LITGREPTGNKTGYPTNADGRGIVDCHLIAMSHVKVLPTGYKQGILGFVRYSAAVFTTISITRVPAG
jgi:hypothetical protein